MNYDPDTYDQIGIWIMGLSQMYLLEFWLPIYYNTKTYENFLMQK